MQEFIFDAIARGGMSVVYRGLDKTLGREVGVKVVSLAAELKVCAAVAVQRVDVVTAHELVVSVAARQVVLAVAAVAPVNAGSARNDVVACTAKEKVERIAAVEVVVARFAVDRGLTGEDEELVCAIASL